MKSREKSHKFYCSTCDYTTFKPCDFQKHCETLKHKSVTNPNFPNQILTKSRDCRAKCRANSKSFVCVCGKSYSHKSTLSAHKKTCMFENISANDLEEMIETNVTHLQNSIVNESNVTKEELLNYFIKENTEFKEILLEQHKMLMKVCEKMNPTISNSNINSNNKTFNLNVFLNEQCKDAMNITDFVDSLQLQLSDLETVGKLGFVEGISSIIIKNLKALDISKRPVHCSDSKREIMYVKDEDKWEKECQENKKIRKAIKRIAYKNTKILSEFREKHPDCGKSESKYSDHYNKLIIEAMGGKGDNDAEKEDKIIKNIAKEVIIEK